MGNGINSGNVQNPLLGFSARPSLLSSKSARYLEHSTLTTAIVTGAQHTTDYERSIRYILRSRNLWDTNRYVNVDVSGPGN